MIISSLRCEVVECAQRKVNEENLSSCRRESVDKLRDGRADGRDVVLTPVTLPGVSDFGALARYG